ncbi:hypothetical protein H4S07_004535 [Coemansia furcata]|uniref:Uncharacterized protein n=1 Tax=Coemansia furcata TaxID=417177 RepID=A0ACC1L8Q6_9FUNG|nr:hypothetical protein H4S07_004535 [Coemansia furcata]
MTKPKLKPMTMTMTKPMTMTMTKPMTMTMTMTKPMTMTMTKPMTMTKHNNHNNDNTNQVLLEAIYSLRQPCEPRFSNYTKLLLPLILQGKENDKNHIIAISSWIHEAIKILDASETPAKWHVLLALSNILMTKATQYCQ